MKNPKRFSSKSTKSEKQKMKQLNDFRKFIRLLSSNISKDSSGQISLEFLILLAAFLSMLALFVPILNNAYELGKFGLESINAKNFSQNFRQKIEQLSILGNNSKFEIEANPSTEWKINSSGKKFFIKLGNNFLNEEKVFSEELPIEIDFPSESIFEKTVFVLKKIDGNISIKNNNP